MIISTSNKRVPVKSKKYIYFIVIPILVVVLGMLTYRPILNKIDQDRFKKLDIQMQSLYKSIKESSNKLDDWTYEKSCEPEFSGPWQTGSYYCTTKISTEKLATSAKEVADLQNKYYPIIDGNKILKAKTELDQQLPGDFGINFVISSAKKRYEEESTKIPCTYLNKTYQAYNNVDFYKNEYGASFKNNTGNINISITCSSIARKNWY